jgi:hypothetical protein
LKQELKKRKEKRGKNGGRTDEIEMSVGNGAGITDGDKTHLYRGVTPLVQIFTFVPGNVISHLYQTLCTGWIPCTNEGY